VPSSIPSNLSAECAHTGPLASQYAIGVRGPCGRISLNVEPRYTHEVLDHACDSACPRCERAAKRKQVKKLEHEAKRQRQQTLDKWLKEQDRQSEEGIPAVKATREAVSEKNVGCDDTWQEELMQRMS